MRTLDKMWDKLLHENNDVTKTKIVYETTNHSMKNCEKEEKHANDNDNGEMEDNNMEP